MDSGLPSVWGIRQPPEVLDLEPEGVFQKPEGKDELFLLGISVQNVQVVLESQFGDPPCPNHEHLRGVSAVNQITSVLFIKLQAPPEILHGLGTDSPCGALEVCFADGLGVEEGRPRFRKDKWEERVVGGDANEIFVGDAGHVDEVLADIEGRLKNGPDSFISVAQRNDCQGFLVV